MQTRESLTGETRNVLKKGEPNFETSICVNKFLIC